MKTLTIDINDHRKIHAIQQEFNTIFPNLNLEFFSKPNTSGGSHSKKIEKRESLTLADCRTQHSDKKITVFPSMSLAELEQLFLDEHGLKIQIVHKIGNSPVQVTERGQILQDLNDFLPPTFEVQ